LEGTSGGVCSYLLLTAGSPLRSDQVAQGFILSLSWKPQRTETAQTLWAACYAAWLYPRWESFSFYPAWMPVSVLILHALCGYVCVHLYS